MPLSGAKKRRYVTPKNIDKVDIKRTTKVAKRTTIVLINYLKRTAKTALDICVFLKQKEKSGSLIICI
jgi:hypothetical protein